MSDVTAALVSAFQQDVCFEAVSRRGNYEPCDLPAVAIHLDPDGDPYPVCSKHVRHPMASLHLINLALDAERKATL